MLFSFFSRKKKPRKAVKHIAEARPNLTLTKARVHVSELKIGMYVRELDRPWEETPFMFRGFNLDSVDDIAAVQQHCEYVVVEGRYLMPLPAGLDPVAAAAVPLVFLTAHGMLVTRAKLQAGESVLVLGGASGVGSAAIQIAKSLGARVIASAGSEAKLSLARELGADEVVDHTDPEWGKKVKAWSDRRGVDVVFEHVGPATWKTSMAVLARNGRLVTCGGTTGPMVQIALPHLFIKNQTIMGSTMGPRSAFPEIFAKVASGEYRPVVDRTLGLSEIVQAHDLLENRGVVGKIVLEPGK